MAKKSHPDVEFHVFDDKGQDRYTPGALRMIIG